MSSFCKCSDCGNEEPDVGAKRRRPSVILWSPVCRCLWEHSENVGPQRGFITHQLLLPPSVCVCLELCPSNATKAQPISTPTVSMEAPCLHLHSPLLASKSVLSWWSLVVVCTLFPRDKFQLELELQTGTSSYHAIYMYEYTSYV